MDHVFIAYGIVRNWNASLQKVVTLSTTKVEYINMTEVVKKELWLWGLARELWVQDPSIIAYCGNNNCRSN